MDGLSGMVKSALDTQVGGGHYKDFPIQPVEFCQKNGLNYCESNVIKYICRWKHKNGIEDLKKIKHYVDLLIELEGLENGDTNDTGKLPSDIYTNVLNTTGDE
jgi:hypothetical protein